MEQQVEKEATPIVNKNAPVAAPQPVVTTTQPQEPVKTETPENKTSPNVDSLIPSDPYYTDPLFYEVASYFDLKQEDYASAKNKLSEIVDYIIRDKKSNKVEDILMGLREIEDKIQPPGWDEKRYTNMYKYIRLAARQQSFSKALKAFEKDGYKE